MPGELLRSLTMIGIAFTATMLLASCSDSASTSVASSSPSQSCGSTMQAWLHGGGGTAFRAALSAASALRSAVASGNPAKLSAKAQQMNSAAGRAYGDVPPSCADPNSNYRLGMGDWMIGAVDAAGGDFKGTSSSIVKGSHEISLISVLKSSVQRVAVPVVAKTTVAATSAPPAPTTPAAPAPPPTTPAAVVPAPTTPAGCYPISNEGTCYEPGEYCRDADHGASGVAGDGEAITCEDNNGWRWEPA